MKKIIISLAFAAFISINANSQTQFNVPANIQLNADADYANYEADIVNAAKWLEETDLNKEVSKRKNVSAFVIQWISGTPKITVEVNQPLMDLYGENSDLLILYMASYSRHFLENKDATKSSATKAGLISMISVYKKGISIIKNKEMEKAVKAFDQNKIDEYIAKKMA